MTDASLKRPLDHSHATSKRFLLLGGDLDPGPLATALAEGGDFTTLADDSELDAFDLVVVNCAGGGDAPLASEQLGRAAPQLKLALDAGVPLLLLDETAAHKEALFSITRMFTSGSNVARFVYPTVDQHGRRGLGFIEQFPLRGCLEPMRVTHHSAASKDAEVTFVEPADMPVPDLTIELIRPFLGDVIGALRRIEAEGSLSTLSQPPAGCPFWAAPSKIYYPLAVGGGSSGAPATTILLTGTAESSVFYDNLSYSEPVQWIYLTAQGFLDASMVQNNSSQRGWANTGLNIVGGNWSATTGFTLYEQSPVNTINSTTYESDSSFTVGVAAGTDGLNANTSYTVESSEQYSISDWSITLKSEASWNFVQQTPYVGEYDGGGIPSGANNMDHANSLPTISTTSLQFSTQSVYLYTTPGERTTLMQGWTFYVYPTYIHVWEDWIGWKGNFWAPQLRADLTITVDMSAALPS